MPVSAVRRRPPIPRETMRSFVSCSPHGRTGDTTGRAWRHAATGVGQLRRLAQDLDARRRNAADRSERLGELGPIGPPFVADYAEPSMYKYVCRLRPDAGIDINRFVAAVAAEGLPISRRYPTPLPQQPVFRDAGFAGALCPVAERLSGELFTLLVHPTVETADLDYYVTAIGKVLKALS